MLRTFILVWIAAVVIALVLDWLGDPRRGRFWPQGDRARGPLGRYRLWRRRREDKNQMVRDTLTAVYGTPTLRLRRPPDDPGSGPEDADPGADPESDEEPASEEASS